MTPATESLGSLITTRIGRVVWADARAPGLLNCPSALLNGAYFPLFVREASGGPCRRALAGFRHPEQWNGLLKPLRRDPVPVTIEVSPRPGGGLVRALGWTVRRPDGRAPSPAPTAPAPLPPALVEQARLVEEAARRLGRELHDEAGQLLAAAHLALDDLRCVVGCPTRRRLPEVKTILDGVEEELRRLARELRPPIEMLGLGPALLSLARAVESRSGLSVRVEDRLGRRLPLETELQLYRVAQEALTNAARHARAARAVVRLHETAAGLALEIEDDGVGLSSAGRTPSEGLGMLTMAERAALLGARLHIGPGAGGGARVSLELPAEPLACVS